VQLWVGLGNPEPGMARNRHNIGFIAIDVIADRHGFSPWRRRFNGVTAEGVIGGEKIIVLKPATYMNESGNSVQPAAAFYKLDPGAMVVFHDELDLAPGKIRVKRGGGAAGHNGLRSIDRRLASQEYWRVRLGIGHPGEKDRVTGHVLGNFTRADEDWLLPMLEAVSESAALLVERKAEDFMTRVAYLTQDSA
jgi:PTH1 family peptidyl-tRNA hydrolase